ncbi:MAG TPA: HAD family hydrolase [Actinomycetota bacterium]|nr:HAD family hydrolase [Actinomycetota bacterium]
MSNRPPASPPRAVLLDVGGTLWPDGFPLPGAEGDHQVEAVRRALPGLSADLARALIREVHARFQRRYEGPGAPEDLAQDTQGELAAALRALGLEPPPAGLDALRRALIVPASPDYLFPGVPELLREVRRLGLRAVLVSNTYLRTGAEYLEDFERFGLRALLDGAVTSVDVGLRKPHRAVFESALRVAGAPPEACVMVGNSERDDIAPARALGMRTVRVVRDGPPPEGTAADALAAGPAEVAAVLRRWAEGAGAPGA